MNTSDTVVAWKWRRLCAPQTEERRVGGIAHAGVLHSLVAQAYFSGPGSSVLIRNVCHGDVQ